MLHRDFQRSSLVKYRVERSKRNSLSQRAHVLFSRYVNANDSHVLEAGHLGLPDKNTHDSKFRHDATRVYTCEFLTHKKVVVDFWLNAIHQYVL